MGENLKDLLHELAAIVERAETCALREALQSKGVERQAALNSHTVLSYMHGSLDALINPPKLEEARFASAMRAESFRVR